MECKTNVPKTRALKRNRVGSFNYRGKEKGPPKKNRPGKIGREGRERYGLFANGKREGEATAKEPCLHHNSIYGNNFRLKYKKFP